MGWEAMKRRYASGETLASQSVEDSVARVILRGMGVKDDEVFVAARAFGITYDENRTTCQRAIEIMSAAVNSTQYGRGLIAAPMSKERATYDIDVRDFCKEDRSDVLEVFETWTERKGKPRHIIVMTRPKGPRYRGKAFAYFLMKPTVLRGEPAPWEKLMYPPMSIRNGIAGYWLVEMNLKTFVENLVGNAVVERIRGGA